MNNYRVDRNDRRATPCGMNSLVYLGGNKAEAVRVFNSTASGIDTWGREDGRYGVVLSEWRSDSYRVLDAKGVP